MTFTCLWEVIKSTCVNDTWLRCKFKDENEDEREKENKKLYEEQSCQKWSNK